MRTGVTLIDITRAADQLLAEGERPTVEGVRKVLGTGSPGTVNTLLKEYYQALPARLNLPAPIATAAAELYEKVRSTAMEEVNQARTELERQHVSQQEALAADKQGFEAEKASLKSQVTSLMSEARGLQEQLGQAAERQRTLEEALSDQTVRASAADARASAATEERERAEQRYISELQHVRDQAAGNERHLLSRIEEAQDQLKRLKVEREREVSASAKRIATLESAAFEAAKELSALRTEIAAAQREAAGLREAAASAEAAALRDRESLVRDLRATEEGRDRALAEGVRLRSELDKAVVDRNEAIREAGRHEGRAAAFQGQVEELSRKHAEVASTLAAAQKPALPSQPELFTQEGPVSP